ncbi:MAG: hypothetical protein IH991_19115 [Planctomycetes bacterium]|nr:hypothetical protein [Planctomycetota bacterium]
MATQSSTSPKRKRGNWFGLSLGLRARLRFKTRSGSRQDFREPTEHLDFETEPCIGTTQSDRYPQAVAFHSAKHQGSNPFSSRFMRPGAIPYLFPQGADVDRLILKLQRNHWWGQIVGQHGSGKSTLLHSLAPELTRCGRSVCWFTLNSCSPALPATTEMTNEWNDATQVIVDGYEQLSARQRRWLKRLCRRNACGLLVTSHDTVNLPEMFRTSIDLHCAYRVVKELLPAECCLISLDDIDTACIRHGGNLREVLFELYDLYEYRRRDQCEW